MPEDLKQLEESTRLLLSFDKFRSIAEAGEPVVPVVVQHAKTKDVLMIGYMNRLALDNTLANGYLTLWSTSRNELWVKGGTSGNRFIVQSAFVNCEQNSLLVTALPEKGGVCHTSDAQGNARRTCYYRKITPNGELSFDISP